MKLLLLLLLAVAAPAAHHSPTPPKTAAFSDDDAIKLIDFLVSKPTEYSAAGSEAAAAKAEASTAYWTKILAFATFGLGVVTLIAVLYPSWERRRDRSEATSAAMRELYQIVTVFKNRTTKLAKTPTFNAEALLQGLDVLIARALADDIARALPRTTDTSYVYHALFTAFDAIADAVHWQHDQPVNRANARDMAVAADVMLQRCLMSLTTELKRRNAEWAPSEIGAWVGTTEESQSA